MKVVLFGATGKSGTRLLNELVSRGHEVTAVARDTSKLSATSNVKVKQDDLSDARHTAEVIRGADAVISAYAPPAERTDDLIGVTQRQVEAVRRAGVDTRFMTLFVYVLSGMAAASAGVILAARLGSGSSNSGQGFELDVIAAVVLGGTSLFGGRGTIIGTVLGALTVAVIGNGLILAHMSPFLTPIVTGTIILVAIWLNFRLFKGATRSR